MTRSSNNIEELVEELVLRANQIENEIESLYEKADRLDDTYEDWDAVSRLRNIDFLDHHFERVREATQLRNEIREEYEVWVARGEAVVSSHLPQRRNEFSLHRQDVKGHINLEIEGESHVDHRLSEVKYSLSEQRNILKSIPGKLDAERASITREVSQTFAKEELEKARDLLDEELTRAAGVLAGVGLERHLQTECDGANLSYDHDDGISALAHTLYKADEISKTTLKSIETLAGIRNDCAHANPKEPNEHKVKRLIDDTDDYIRGRGI